MPGTAHVRAGHAFAKGAPLSQLSRIRLNCDYAEVDVKPENLNPACSGRALWQVPRLNAAG